jgi:ribosomal protein S9
VTFSSERIFINNEPFTVHFPKSKENEAFKQLHSLLSNTSIKKLELFVSLNGGFIKGIE